MRKLLLILLAALFASAVVFNAGCPAPDPCEEDPDDPECVSDDDDSGDDDDSADEDGA